jgi:hypothetical protein
MKNSLHHYYIDLPVPENRILIAGFPETGFVSSFGTVPEQPFDR